MDKRRCSFFVIVAGVLIVCFCYASIQICFAIGEIGQQHEPMIYPRGKPTLGIVLPLFAEERIHAVDALKRWPTKCSETTRSRIDLILYLAEELPLDFDRQLGDASASTSCFKKTKVVSASLQLGVRIDQSYEELT